MADFHQQDLADSRFEQVHLQRARFHQVHLNDADFDDVDLTGARFREAWFKDVVMRGVGFLNTRIDGEIEGLTVNGVDVAPLVQAELERREPDLARMRPTDPDGSARPGTSSSDCGPTPSSGPGAAAGRAARVGRRRVVVHRDAAAPLVRDRVLAAPGDPRRPEPLRRAVAALGRDAGHRRRAA
jgi:hypothetical protein